MASPSNLRTKSSIVISNDPEKEKTKESYLM